MHISQIDGYGQVRSSPAGTVKTDASQAAESGFREKLEAAAAKNSGSQSLDPIFREASAAYGVPVKLVKAVAKAESDFNPKVVSKAGASGVMQLMPATARELGVKNIFDPRENIFGGVRYLKERLDEFGGNVELALAAYNAGSGNVKKYGGIPPFKETQNYVKKIMGYLGQDGELYSPKTTSLSSSPSNNGTYNSGLYGLGSGTYSPYGISGSGYGAYSPYGISGSGYGTYSPYGMPGSGYGAYNTYGMPGLSYGVSGADYNAFLSGELDKDKAFYLVELMRLQMNMGFSRSSFQEEGSAMWL